ncbi:thiamine pyrophosphate-dependent enzyme [Elongatibacter sediminis]|uniref:Thiamine pyrophosphate-dependent enzyme n=1 Tax=Elongatibacter sediminis TaxID=3119006 RepID=A0AAW9R9B3_9GAMM
MPNMTGADAIVASLTANGVDTLFGLPGGQLDHLFDSVYRLDDAPRLIHSRHEQGAAYMAFGYAQSTGKVGAYTVVPGPGLLNSTAALCTAWACGSPVLAISGQVHLKGIDSGYGHLHEIPDQLGMVRHITKWAERINHPTQTAAIMDQAFSELRSGRVRPVEVEMPMDVMGASAEVAQPRATQPPPPPPVNTDQIREAAQLLAKSRRPLIVIGGGALDAGTELLAIAERLQAPVVAKRKGKGVVSDDHYLSQNLPAGHRLWGEADAVLAVGTRLKMPLTMWGRDGDLKLVRVDIDPVELTRIAEPDVGIVGDARAVLAALAEELERTGDAAASREEELRNLKQGIGAQLREKIAPQMAYLDTIRAALPRDGYFVDEVTQVGFASWYGFPVYEPRHFISACQQGTLGYGFATALGVAAAHPDKAVVQVSGDGGFMFTMQELATAVHYGLNLVTVIFNDNTFSNVQRQQDEWFDGRRICSDLTNPDFVKMAESFGAGAYRVGNPAELAAALPRAFNEDGPTLIEVTVTERMPTPWPFILMPQNRRSLCD